jgi:hypothetical protein
MMNVQTAHWYSSGSGCALFDPDSAAIPVAGAGEAEEAQLNGELNRCR